MAQPDRALHRCTQGHRFESRSSPNFFQVVLFQLFKLMSWSGHGHHHFFLLHNGWLAGWLGLLISQIFSFNR